MVEIKSKQQLMNFTTDYITTEEINSPTEIVTHPMLTVQDIYRIGNETKRQNYERVLQILLTRTNAQRQHIVHYYKTFEMSLIKEMENIQPNNLKLLIEDLLTDTSILFAEELYKAISTSNIQITTSLLIDFWGDEFDQVKNVYKLYTYSVNKPMYFATLFHDVLHKELISVLTAQRLLILRSEVDLQLVCDIYDAMYGIYLSDDVKQKYFGKQDNALTNLLKLEGTHVLY
ncbi:unnamed protein product [Schistosoma rodhaini]|uniref:Annexin n=1 Tax=Schistosoma rodhaini TaxID=6188 RepID=A0AA85GFV0_9TREM|nr:unnamed protein product [Schistosoma rodhaini]